MSETILVAVASATSRQLIQSVFVRHGFEVAATGNGNEALEMCAETDPAVVICDADLEGTTGMDLCQALRDRASRARVVLLFSTRIPEVHRRGISAQCGADASFGRPFSLPPVRKLLEDWSLLVKPPLPEPSFSFSVPMLGPAGVSPAAPGALRVPRATPPAADPEPTPGEVPVAALVPEAEPPSPPPPELELELEPADNDDAPPAPRAEIPTGLPPRGDLDQFPLPRLLFELYLGTFSGRLYLRRRGVDAVIAVAGGEPAAVTSDALDDTLGMVLKEQGRLTDAQYEATQRLMLDQKLRFGETLLEQGFLRESELVEILRQQTQRKLVRLFSWRHGEFEIEPSHEPIADPSHPVVEPIEAIWSGISEHYQLVELFDYFTRLGDQYAVPSPLLAVHYRSLFPFLGDLDLASRLDGQTTVEAILKSDPTRAQTIAQMLYLLVVTEMVRTREEPGEPVALPEAPQTEVRTTSYQELTEIYDRIADEYGRLDGASAFTVLCVGDDVSNEEVQRSYDTRIRELQLGELPAGLPGYVMRRAQDIREILAAARDALSTAEGRERELERWAEERTTAPSDDEPRDSGVARREKQVRAERLYREGVQLLRSGDPMEARERLAKAIELTPREATYHVGMAQSFLAADPPDRASAASHLEEALRLNPSHISANLELARLYVDAGQAAAAGPHLERVLNRAPGHPGAEALMRIIDAGG